jgi:hypothetical protein
VAPVVRTTLEAITGKLGKLDGIDRLQTEVREGTGRISAIQRELATKAKQTGEPAPTKQAIVAAFESPEKLKKLTEEWPDVGEAVADALARERQATTDAILKQVPQVDVDGIKKDVGLTVAEQIAAAEKRITLAAQFERVTEKYPTWNEDIRTPDGKALKPEFAAWMQTQAPEVQALASSDYARDALKMLDLYYEHKKAVEKKETKDKRLASVVTPPQANSGGPTVLPDEAGLSAGYNRIKKRA